jgi:cytochrome c
MVYRESAGAAIDPSDAAMGRVGKTRPADSMFAGCMSAPAPTEQDQGYMRGGIHAFLTHLALAAVVLAAPGPAAAQDGNAEEGAEVFKKCRACHDVGPDARNKVGPLLNGIIGRKAGTIDGFAYSDANKTAGAGGLVWTEDVLFKYLENPLTFMKGTKMAFAGLKDAQDRKDVIAYLKKFSK